MSYSITDRMDGLFMSAGLGAFSLTKYLVLVFVLSAVLVAIPALVATVRGAGRFVAMRSARDVLVGIPCALLIFTIPFFFFFVGRGYMTAFFGHSASES